MSPEIYDRSASRLTVDQEARSEQNAARYAHVTVEQVQGPGSDSRLAAELYSNCPSKYLALRREWFIKNGTVKADLVPAAEL
jgi:hypothetical protein